MVVVTHAQSLEGEKYVCLYSWHTSKTWKKEKLRERLSELMAEQCAHRRQFVGTMNMTALYRCTECGEFSLTPDKKRF